MREYLVLHEVVSTELMSNDNEIQAVWVYEGVWCGLMRYRPCR